VIGNPCLVPFIKGKGNEVREIAQGYMNGLHVFDFSGLGFEQKCGKSHTAIYVLKHY
jgi:hypothetical protein